MPWQFDRNCTEFVDWVAWTYKITPNNTGDVEHPGCVHGFSGIFLAGFESKPVCVFERLFPGQEACIPTMKAGVRSEVWTQAGQLEFGGRGRRGHPMWWWYSRCSILGQSSVTWALTGVAIMRTKWDHACGSMQPSAWHLVRTQQVLSSSVLISV